MRNRWLSAASVSLILGAAACGASKYPMSAMARSSMAPPAMEMAQPSPAAPAEPNTESYARVQDNPFLDAARNPLSTFSIDVDTASYSNVRRFLDQGSLPPADAVRIEEMINYFPYNYAQPTGDAPVAVNAEVAGCPWNAAHRLVRIGLQARSLQPGAVPPRNLVFLVDVSGSMSDQNKLPLVVNGLRMLVDQLNENDRIAIVVYAGSQGLALPPTSGDRKGQILAALDQLGAGGSTNGAAGIQLAYQVARQNFRKDGINRVILATDGDFNVGTTDQSSLEHMIEEERKSGVFLTVLGVGSGNTKDSTMEMLADKGNGNYAYLDSAAEARKVLVTQAGSTLVTVAKDVKIQVEFNPSRVQSYRLVGYENRMLRAEDFRDDRKDAGEMGAGHSVTALYEIVPPGAPSEAAPVDPLKYQRPAGAAAPSDDLLTVKMRYKQPDGDVSRELAQTVKDGAGSVEAASVDFRFAASVAAFGMLLRSSEHKGQATYGLVRNLAEGALGPDTQGYRHEFVRLAQAAEKLSPAADRKEIAH